MLELIARFILNLLMPLNFSLILMAGSGLFLLFKWYKISICTMIAAVFLLVVSVTPVIPNLLISDLEGRFNVMHDPSTIVWHQTRDHISGTVGQINSDTVREDQDSLIYREVHILVLGGGHNPNPWLPATTRLSSWALGRLAEGIRLHRMLPDSRLIFSGWSASGGESVAEVMGQAALALGVDSTRISLLTEPSNTCREAQVYNSVYGSSHPLILVTTASHMPRSMQLFRQTGLNPVPAPAGHRIKFPPDRRKFKFRIDPSNISKLEAAIKEHVGMMWGRWDCN